MTRFAAILVALLAASAQAAPLDPALFWVGEGANSATLVLDWHEAPDIGPTLAWGYRWDGDATAGQMLFDVVAADPRLYLRHSTPGQYGVAVYGFGYDGDADNAFALNDQTPFDAEGFAITGPSDVAVALGAADVYAEGWAYEGYWHRTLATAEDPAWRNATTTLTGRLLADGDREGWVFTELYDPDWTPRPIVEIEATTPGAAIAAPPLRPTPGDVNGDGRVDAADYTVWRDAAPGPVPVVGAGADVDLSGVIDAGDDAAWRDHYGQTLAPEAAATPLPEPRAAGSVLLSLLTLLLTPWRRVS